MAATRAATTHDKQKNPKPTGQMSQGQTFGQRQPEHVSESSPPLHRYLGNSYVQAMTTQKQRNTRLKINEPGDIYEREADRAADQVMAASTHGNISSAPLQIQRFSDSSYGQGDAAPASVAQTFASPGRPLEPALRQDMEQRFGHDLSRVRVHTDAAAAQSARDVKARAYTMGHDIVFGAGRFAPETTAGRRLIAHELTHVAQMSAFGAPASLTAALRLPILRQPESGADADAEERRRRTRASWAWTESTPPYSVARDGVRMVIDWAKKQQIKFEDPQRTDEERTHIAQGLLRAFQELREFEGRAKHDPDGALVYSYMGDQKPWTQDRAHKLDDIAPFTAANIAEWREAEAWRPPVTSHAKQPPKKKTPPRQKQPPELPERHSFAVDVTFPKQEGMTFKTEEGQRHIAFALIRSTRSTYTNEQIAWAVSRIDLSKWWAPPGNLDLPAWKENFEAAAIGDKVTMGLSKKFDLELGKILLDLPTEHDFRVELGRQAVLSAAPTLYLAYAAPAGLMAGTIIGSGLTFLPGTGTVGGGGLTTGGGGLLAGGEGSLLLGGTIRQSALYAARYLYLNAPQLYGRSMAYGGALLTGAKLGQHLIQISREGLHLSDIPQFAEDLLPAFGGYSERSYFRSGGGGTQPPPARPVTPPVGTPAPVTPTPPVVSVRPPTAPVGPAATGSRIPVDVTHGKPFNVPLVTPTAPAPAPPVTPPIGTRRTVEPPASVKPAPPARPSTAPPAQAVVAPAPVKPASPVAPVHPFRLEGLRGWRFGTKWKLAMEGFEASGAAPGIGAGGATGSARPTPAVVVKTTPSPAAPTPDPLPPTPAPPRAVSPAKIVTPSAPSRPTTTTGAVRTPAPATPTSSAVTGRLAGRLRQHQSRRGRRLRRCRLGLLEE